MREVALEGSNAVIHFKPSTFLRALSTTTATAAPVPVRPCYNRAEHARMMAHAARRRFAAASRNEDAGYWKACAPAAIAKAASIRANGGFARLP